MQALKLQQKTVPRILGDMQKNVTLAIAAIASEVSALHRRVSEIEDSSAIPAATCAAALPGSGDGQIRCALSMPALFSRPPLICTVPPAMMYQSHSKWSMLPVSAVILDP